MEERKITLVDDDQTLEFYVVEETKLNGANYLLVTDAEDDDEEGERFVCDFSAKHLTNVAKMRQSG